MIEPVANKSNQATFYIRIPVSTKCQFQERKSSIDDEDGKGVTTETAQGCTLLCIVPQKFSETHQSSIRGNMNPYAATDDSGAFQYTHGCFGDEGNK